VIGALVQIAKTLDQAKVLMEMVEVLVNKTNKATVALNAARGRGKSAAIGLAIAAATKLGYSNIFVTAPSPLNLKTLFEFVVSGLELLGFKERMDFERVLSNNKEYEGAVMRVDLYKTHTQFIQYVFPTDADKIGHTDLVVID
jgi:N-acetyltransferase 10